MEPRGPVPQHYPLEPSADEMRRIAQIAVDFLVGFIEDLPKAPASDFSDIDRIVERFRGGIGEEGTDFAHLVPVLDDAAGKGIDTANPGFLGYIPGGGLYLSAIAALIGFGLNRYVTVWDAAPAFAQIEASLLRWFADLFEFPPEARGVLTSGGSLANFSAIVTARNAQLGEEFLRGTVYTSEHAHHSVLKAAVLAGFPRGNVRLVPCTPDLRIDLTALDEAIDRDRRDGWRPFCVVANGGTTNTGTVDPLRELVGLAHERRMWIHVDAAYGGFFQLTERGRKALRGIVGADSITLDPHKGLFVPYGTGCLIVRDGERLHDAHRVAADYMQDRLQEREIPSFTDYSAELSRDFRGLRVWLPLKVHGVRAFREALDEKLDLTRLVYDELRKARGFEVPWEPDTSVVAFRYRPSNGEDADALNRKLIERVNGSRRIFLSSTTVDGRFVLRVCILSHRTHRDRVEEGIEIIKEAAAELDR